MKWNILVGSLVLGLGLSTQSFGMDLLDRMLGMNYNGGCDTASCCETSCCDPGPSCGCETGCDACAPCAKKCRKTPLLDLLRGNGCKKSSCSEPACGCEAACDPGCGCETACDPGCGVEPACGCEDPCAGQCSKAKKCRRPLLDFLKSCRKKNSCSEPACGCETACDPGCGCEPACGCEVKVCTKKRCHVSLLDRIFGKKCGKKKSCCEPACGCETACDPGCGCEVACDPGCGCEPACGCESGGAISAPAGEPKEAVEDEVGEAPVVDPSAFLPTKRRFIQTNLVR